MSGEFLTSFREIVQIVDQRRNDFLRTPDIPFTLDKADVAVAYFAAETCQHCLEAALLDGVDPDRFIAEIIRDLNIKDLESFIHTVDLFSTD